MTPPAPERREIGSEVLTRGDRGRQGGLPANPEAGARHGKGRHGAGACTLVENINSGV